MNKLAPNRKAGALTLIEVLVVVAVLALLVGLVLSAISQARRKAQRIDCVKNLKQMGLAFRIWLPPSETLSGGMRPPMTVPTNSGGTLEYVAAGETFGHFLVMSNELSSPKILVCPADKRQPAKSWATLSNTNISYFVGPDADETQPDALLAGDRNLEIDGAPAKPGLLLLLTNSVLGWTHELHNRSGNVAMSDGSVVQLTDEGLRRALLRSGATNRLAIP